LYIQELSDWHDTGDVLRLMALPHLKCLEVRFHRCDYEQVERFRDESDKYPKVELKLDQINEFLGPMLVLWEVEWKKITLEDIAMRDKILPSFRSAYPYFEMVIY
jgi:hypothetical protein